MSNLVIPAPKQTLIPVHGTDSHFPVRRVYCIGRNYAAHTIEMGFDPDKEPPFFFQKNTDNIDTTGQFPYPPETSDVHYELELVVALNKGGANIKEEDAYDHIFGFGIGLDMTRRDLQGVCIFFNHFNNTIYIFTGCAGYDNQYVILTNLAQC